MFEISCHVNENRYRIHWDRRHDLAIPLDPSGPQPSYLLDSVAQRRTLVAGSFVGDIHRGGSCNVDTFELTPHCHGTHTESVSHIADPFVAIGPTCPPSLFLARLLTMTPKLAKSCPEEYRPDLRPGDCIISAAQLDQTWKPGPRDEATALIVRTSPNPEEKKGWKYSSESPPAFFTNDALRTIVAAGVQHLLVDLPSIDRLDDDGLLSNHRIFWNVKPDSQTWTDPAAARRTISEMLYVADAIPDGLYALMIAVPAWQADAAPSRPLLFDLEPV